MQKPWVIGILSIVPGLGFIVLGQLSQGLFIMAIVAFFALGALFSPWETISTISATLGMIAWGTQLVYAFIAAPGMASQEEGTGPAEQPDLLLSPPPPGASLGERQLHEARQVVLRLMQPGEQLRVALQGQTGTPSLLWVVIRAVLGDYWADSDIRQVYLGATGQDFLLVESDPLGKLAELRRIPLGQARLVHYSRGLLLDEVKIDLGQASPLRVQLPRWVRPGTRQLVGILCEKEAPRPQTWEAARQEQHFEAGQALPALAAASEQVHRSKHPILLAAQLGAGGGLAGTLAAAFFTCIGVLLVDLLSPIDSSEAEGWGYLIGLYCLVMFPVGGAILGGIPGVIVGALRRSLGKPPALMPPLLAGLLTVFLLSLAGLVLVLLSYL
jgi:hypothetical protein